MPRLLLEGKSITALLAQVRAEHGDEVTIVAAEKVRSGGLGGFFAKESYALTVEVDALPADAPATSVLLDRAPVDTPGSLLDLAAAIDEAEAAENGVILATRPMHRIEEPLLSTASPEFASILARLTALDGPQAPAETEAAAPQSGTSAAEPAVRADAYTRLREALAEIAPHIDFGTSVPLVLVIPPAATAPTTETTTETTTEATAAPAAVIPRQGRHRRAAAEA